MTVSDYITEFGCLNNKAKHHKMKLPDGVLAYRVFNSANTSSHHKQLVRATLPELSYQSMKDKLKKIFSDPTNLVRDVKQEQAIKGEPAMEAQDVYFFSSRGARGRESFGRSNKVVNWRSEQIDQIVSFHRGSRKINPLNVNGEISCCHTCGSIFHWSYACPDSYESRDPAKEKDFGVQIQLLEKTMETLIGETLSSEWLSWIQGVLKLSVERHGSTVIWKLFQMKITNFYMLKTVTVSSNLETVN